MKEVELYEDSALIKDNNDNIDQIDDIKEEYVKEITLRGLFIALFLGTIMAAANTYLGLYVGLTISVSIPSAIISVSILKSFGTTLQEINAIQTASSAGSLIATGMMFSFPALIIIGYWDTIHWFETATVGLIGGLLGVLFSIPIRRALIVEKPLKFPEGVATAEVLKTTLPPKYDESSTEYIKAKKDTRKGLLLLLFGGIIGCLLKFSSSSFFLWNSIASWAFWANSAIIYFGITLSPALTSMGYIIGLHPACMMLLGSIFCWWIATPITMAYYDETYLSTEDTVSIVNNVWSDTTRYIGIGAMLFGGIGTIFLLAKPIFNGVKSGIKAFLEARKGNEKIPRTEKDIPVPLIAFLVVFFIIPLFLLCWYFTRIWYVGLFSSIFMILFGFLFSCVGAYMAGIVGTSQNPISGVTLATVITAALILLIFLGFENPIGPPAAILIGSVICCAASLSGDSMQDLKTGYIVKSTPFKQQLMQIFGIIIPSLLLPIILSLVIQAYGIGEPTSQHPEPLIAPQANLIGDIAYAIFFGGAPIWMVVIGAILAVVIVIMDIIFTLCKIKFRFHVLSVALGLYLPFENNVTIFLGGIVGLLTTYTLRKVYPDNNILVEENFRFGLLFAAGVITGEALTGILTAIPVVISGNVYLMSLVGGAAKVSWPGIILLFTTMIINYIIPCYPALIYIVNKLRS